jgi:hypothetical protein
MIDNLSRRVHGVIADRSCGRLGLVLWLLGGDCLGWAFRLFVSGSFGWVRLF